MKKEKLDEWLELLSDEQRAEVMKTYIRETQETNRMLASDPRHNDTKQGYIWATALVLVLVTVITGAVTCDAHEKNLETQKVLHQAK